MAHVIYCGVSGTFVIEMLINFHQMVDIFKTTSNKWLDLVAICDVKNRNICHKTSTWNFKACTHKSHIQFTDETKV